MVLVLKNDSFRRRAAFTLIEVMISVGLLLIAIVSFYAGLGTGFSLIRGARENLRATQIMIERFEAIRLFTWDQIQKNLGDSTSTNYVGSVTEYYDIIGTNIPYNVTISFSTNYPPDVDYKGDMGIIVVQVTWNTAGILHSNQMT